MIEVTRLDLLSLGELGGGFSALVLLKVTWLYTLTRRNIFGNVTIALSEAIYLDIRGWGWVHYILIIYLVIVHYSIDSIQNLIPLIECVLNNTQVPKKKSVAFNRITIQIILKIIGYFLAVFYDAFSFFGSFPLYLYNYLFVD